MLTETNDNTFDFLNADLTCGSEMLNTWGFHVFLFYVNIILSSSFIIPDTKRISFLFFTTKTGNLTRKVSGVMW